MAIAKDKAVYTATNLPQQLHHDSRHGAVSSLQIVSVVFADNLIHREGASRHRSINLQ